MLNKLN